MVGRIILSKDLTVRTGEIQLTLPGTRVQFCANSLNHGDGGIAYVARLTAKVLNENMQKYSIAVSGLTFSDIMNHGEYDFPLYSCGRSKLLFAVKNFCAHFRKSIFIYDSCNLAQAHLGGWVNRPYAVFVHGIEVWENAKKSWISACRNADVLIVNSNYTLRRLVANHGPFNNAKVCWLGTENENIPEIKVPIEKRGDNVLIVSRIEKSESYKGHIELLKVWPKIITNVPEAKLHVVGDGNGLEELKSMADSMKLNKHIVFHGFVPHSMLEELYSRSKVFAMPSRGEGFGLVYIDAMRYGIPVITSTHDAGCEVSLNNENGFSIDLDQNEIGIAEKIILLLKNTELSKQLGINGRQRWLNNFTYTHFERRLLSILLPLIA